MVRQVRPHKRWPSGDSIPLLMLQASPAELAERYGLTFAETHDDLDSFDLAAIALPDGSQAWLERHHGDPLPGTVVHVDAHSDLKAAKDGIQQVLELRAEDLVWVSPLVASPNHEDEARSDDSSVEIADN